MGAAVKITKRVRLENFAQEPRDYQQRAIDKALASYNGEGGSLLLALPTGTGKGSIQLGLLRAFHRRGVSTVIVTPSLEVVRGYLERCGATTEDLADNAGKLTRLGESIHVYTPVRLRNMLRTGRATAPQVVVMDEAHHATERNVQGGGLRALCPGATWIGFTATPYRGSPEETAELRRAWGSPHIALTIPQAIDNHSWALPKWKVEAIVDDDRCGIRAGDIDADEVTVSVIEPLANCIAKLDLSIPTCVTVPSVTAANMLADEMSRRQVRNTVIIGETPAERRAEIYAMCAKGGTLLISVRVLGEGVDMPWLRRWVDASPTLSPVAFLQKLGRITRPGDVQPEYLGTNRNLERHGYLLQGALPREEIRAAQEAFGGASVRGGRVGLIKAVAKLKPIQLPLRDGVKATMWALWQPNEKGGMGWERCVILDPTSDRVISAEHEISPAGYTRTGPGWRLCALPEKLEGFKVAKQGGPCSDRQWAWWKGSAHLGIDTTVRPNKAQIYALPVLTDTRTSMVQRATTRTLKQAALFPNAQKPSNEVQGTPYTCACGKRCDGTSTKCVLCGRAR